MVVVEGLDDPKPLAEAVDEVLFSISSGMASMVEAPS